MHSTIRRVVVADDDPNIRQLLVMNLEAEGYDVLEADNGDAALELARTGDPDLLVLDVMMPCQDGMDVLRCVRGDEETRELPVVLLTAKSTESEIWAGWQAGADYYITKPFDLDEVLRFLRYLDEQKRDAGAPEYGEL